jgi:hypothetical protein
MTTPETWFVIIDPQGRKLDYTARRKRRDAIEEAENAYGDIGAPIPWANLKIAGYSYTRIEVRDAK